MLNIALLVFAVTAVGGLILAALHFRGKHRPLPLALVHLLGGATGLVLLLLAVLNGQAPEKAKLALGLFLAAALGGFVLLSFRLQKKSLSSPVVVIHAGVAVAAFVLLLLTAI